MEYTNPVAEQQLRTHVRAIEMALDRIVFELLALTESSDAALSFFSSHARTRIEALLNAARAEREPETVTSTVTR